MLRLDVPGEVEPTAKPRARAHRIFERKPRAEIGVGDLDIVRGLPDRSGLEFEDESRVVPGICRPGHCQHHHGTKGQDTRKFSAWSHVHTSRMQYQTNPNILKRRSLSESRCLLRRAIPIRQRGSPIQWSPEEGVLIEPGGKGVEHPEPGV